MTQDQPTRTIRRDEYHAYLQSPHWRRTRKVALIHADNRCQVCNATARLDVHHRTYERLGAERPADLTVLCRKCHDLFHAAKAAGPAPLPVAPAEDVERVLMCLAVDGPQTAAMVATRIGVRVHFVRLCFVELKSTGLAEKVGSKKRWQVSAKGRAKVSGSADGGLARYLSGDAKRVA